MIPKITSAILLLLLIFISCRNESTAGGGTTIAQYRIDSMRVHPATLFVGDTLTASVCIGYLDCTMNVTRIDTLLNTLSSPFTDSIAVYGTVWTGPGPRPMCAARLTWTDVAILLPQPGSWIIVAGDTLRDTITVLPRR